jgi:tRNA(adenine34) deaminase
LLLLFNPEITPAQIDEHFMVLALKEAEIAESREEIPIGAVVVLDNKVIGRGNNSNKTLQDPTAHAEMIAITASCNQLQSRYLDKATLYVTIEPCAMCAGAIVLARLPRLVFGAKDPKAGACGSLFNIVQDPRLNHRVEVIGGVREFECAALISAFFESIREKRK